MNYEVLKSDSHSGLEIKVERWLRKGWMLQGGVAVGGGFFCQAMTKEN